MLNKAKDSELTLFGINIEQLDMSLKVTYDNLGDPNSDARIKESKKFFGIEIYISDFILQSVKADMESDGITSDEDIDRYIREIKKIFDYKKNKVLLKVSEYSISDVNKMHINSSKSIVAKNCVAVMQNDSQKSEALNNFFKEYNEYITYRKIVSGAIKSDYYSICNIIFFNSNLYCIEELQDCIFFNIKSTNEEEEKVNAYDK